MESTPRVTAEDCRQFIEEKIFKLRPAEYGIKYSNWPGAVGLEIEMLPVVQEGRQIPELLPLQGETNSLAAFLRHLARTHPWKLIEESGTLKEVILEDGDRFTFEPGGQIEISTITYPCMDGAVKRVNEVQTLLRGELAEHGYNLFSIGANPWHSADELGLQMNKPRYKAMNQYFNSIGPYGKNMMRRTMTMQVCLDLGDTEEKMAKRFLAGQIVAPAATAIFCYSPFDDKRPTEALSSRAETWRYLDPSRTGLLKMENIFKRFDKASCVDSYFDFLMNSRVVFIDRLDYRVLEEPFTFGEWLENPVDGMMPTHADLETQLSLLFPEVRARGFLEFRSVDAPAEVWQIVPAAFYTGLLYSDEILDKVIELGLENLGSLNELLFKSHYGLGDEKLRKFSQTLMDLAVEGFADLPSCFRPRGATETLLKYKEIFTDQGRTPAEDLVESWKNDGATCLSIKLIKDLEESWIRSIEG